MSPHIAVVGDCIIDRWVWGHFSKIGPEGVPVFLEERREDRQGGAANVAANIRALGGHAYLFGKMHHEWPIKTRYSNGHAVFRSDHEDCSPANETLQRTIMGALESLNYCDVLVLSDYAKGVLVPEFCRALIRWAKGRRIPVIVDPKSPRWMKYRGCAVITPNEAEWAAADLARDECYPVLVTKGPKGMTLFRHGQPALQIPAIAREVYDVCGAGDTVTATLAWAMAKGDDLETAARMANVAAGVVVGKKGTSVCTREELESALSSDSPTAASTAVTKGIAIFSKNVTSTVAGS